MRPVQILSIILVLALLVGAAGWFASTSDTDDATIADVEETTPAFTPDEPAAADLVAPADDFTPALGRAAIEDDVTPVAAEEGSAYIHGRVVDAVGKPLADAHIEVRAGGARGFPAGMHFPGMESLEAGSTRSATDGTFRVAVSQVGDLRLNVRKRGYTLLRRDVAVTEGSDTPLGDLALDRGVVLSGVVVDSAGRPIAGAQIHKPIERTQGDFMIFSPASQGPVAATTGHDGKFEVAHQAVGPWSLTISSEKHPSEKAEGETTQAGQHESGIHVVLDDGFSIQGRVTGIPAGEGGLLVRASEKASSPLGGIDFGGIELMGGGRREADVESDGSFAIEGLRRDTEYSLRVRVADAQVWTGGARSATVKALAGSTGVELEYSAGAALVFQVVDGRTGDPLTNFMVEAGIDWTMPHEDQEFEDGRVRYGNLRPRGDNSKARVKISAVGFGDYAQDGIAIRADEEVDLGVIRMISASVIRVTVLDEETNEPVEGARVTLTPETNPGQNVVFERSLAFGATELGEDMPMFGGEGESGKTDENGVAVVPNLPGETCTLRVTSKQHAPYRSAEFLAPSVGDGEREVQISRGGSVNVLALDTAGEPLEGVRVKHQAPGSGAMGQMMGGPSGSKTDDEGRVAFDRLEAGEHMFKLEEDNPKTQGGGMVFLSSPGGPDADMSDWTAVVVAGGQMADITLHAAPRSSVHGIVTEAGSLLSGAKVSLLKPEKEGDMMGGMMGFPSFGGGTSATTDSQGRYSFDDIRADEYRIEVTHPTREMPTFVPVEFGQGENKENINLSVAIVEGRVTDEAGEAVIGARVSAQRVTGSAGGQRMVFAVAMDDGDGETIISNGPGGKATKTDEDGRYLLRGVASEVEIEVSANSGSFQPASETLTLGADEVRGNVDLLMRKAGEIKVTVLLADGSQAREVLIEGRFAGEIEDGESVDPEVEFSMSGSGKLRKLRAGKWTVLARAVGPVEEGTGSEPVVVDVVPGETADVTVQLP